MVSNGAVLYYVSHRLWLRISFVRSSQHTLKKKTEMKHLLFLSKVSVWIVARSMKPQKSVLTMKTSERMAGFCAGCHTTWSLPLTSDSNVNLEQHWPVLLFATLSTRTRNIRHQLCMFSSMSPSKLNSNTRNTKLNHPCLSKYF